MEQTILLKGIALMSALTGLQHWLIHTVTLYDLMFVALVSLFLITLERDYLHYIGRKDYENKEDIKTGDKGENKKNHSCSGPKEKDFFFEISS